MLTFYNSPALLTPMCVPAPGPVRCHLQSMYTKQVVQTKNEFCFCHYIHKPMGASVYYQQILKSINDLKSSQ